MDFLALFITIILAVVILMGECITPRYLFFMIAVMVILWGMAGISYTREPSVTTKTVISTEYKELTFSRPVKITKTHTSYPFTLFRDSHEVVINVVD